MDYNKFNDKYKNILEIFENVEKPIVSEPFDNNDKKKDKDPFSKSLFSNGIREIISLIGYSIVSITLIGTYAYSNNDNRFKNTMILLFLLVGIPLLATIMYFIISKPSGEAPLAKTTIYMAFLFLGGLLFISLPQLLAGMTLGKSIADLDMSLLLISLTVMGLTLLSVNMYYGSFDIERGKNDLYISLLGIFLGFLVFSKVMSSTDTNDKNFGTFWWLISLFVLVISILHNEFSILGNSIDKKNLQVFVGFILAIILLLFILHALNIKIPLIGRGVIVAGIVMFMAFINNEMVPVYDAENDTTLYTFAGIIALLMGIQTSGEIFKTDSVQGSKTYIEELRDTSTGFAQGIGFRLLALLIVLIIGYRYLVVVRDNVTSTQQFQIAKDVILYVFPIFLIMLFGTNIFKATSGIWLMLYALITMTLLFGYFYLISNITNSQKDLVNYVSTILFILSATIALAILFLLVGNYMTSLKGVPGIISNLLFYIPCLIIQLIDWLKDQISNTTPTMGILLIVEIIIILTYFYLPKILKKATETSGIEIINNPTKLDEQIELVGGDRFKIPKDPDELTGFNTKDKPRYNYSISFWTFINTNVNNGDAVTNDLNIFSYDGKPNLKFRINEDNPDGEVSHFIIEVTNEDKTDDVKKLKIYLPLQKWHYFVFNYNDNAVDVFVNGELNKTYTFSENNRPTYDIVTDNLLIGDNRGLSGSICNTKYHTIPLTNSEIVNTYNLLMNNNPPIINL